MKKALFLLGLGLLCLSVLVQQICLTRILSVMTYFHLAFVSISMAMLGLTAGAVFVYLKGYKTSDLPVLLPRFTSAYAISSFVALLFICSTYVPFDGGMNGGAALIKIVCCMAVPFILAGMSIALCLTRGDENGSINLRYAVDLIGAAAGCLLCIPLLDYVTGPYAVICASFVALLSWLCFKLSLQKISFKERIEHAGMCAVTLIGVALLISIQDTPMALQAPTFKSPDMMSYGIDYRRWNTFSNIMLSKPNEYHTFYWGESPIATHDRHSQRFLVIDGMAGTPMYKFDGDYSSMGFLKYDITNLAYAVRNSGHSAVIGIGGGRDALAARHFGFDDVTVVELNPIIANLLTTVEPYASYAHLGSDPKIHFNIDDGRSWFARTTQKFDLIQMSMIDTFAATGAGGFTLSENGLYTVEGWQHFLNALTPDGMFTVSRWYSPHNLNETGRVAALALASLWRYGIEDAEKHIYLAGIKNLATLIISKSPFTDKELAALDKHSAEMQFDVLMHPGQPPSASVLAEMVKFHDEDSLNNYAGRQLLDMSAPTDNRPFFFNQLRLFDISSMSEAFEQEGAGGIVQGNLRATLGLLLVVIASALAIVFILLLPTLHAVKDVNKAFARAGTFYFLLIGLGFMLVEIALIQRTSLFLGHPTYGLAIALFSLILATGIGSFISGLLGMTTSYARLRLFPLTAFALLMLTTFIGPKLMTDYESATIAVRGLIAVLTIAPPALLMGFAFPIGMTLSERIDAKPTPWFWSVNGAAGVLASGLGVIISMNFSIPVTLMCGAFCYLLLLRPMSTLYALGK